MTPDTVIALGIMGLFYLAVAVLTVILARRAPKAEHMAKHCWKQGSLRP